VPFWSSTSPAYFQQRPGGDQRVFVGDTPPKRQLVAANRTKYASAITIKKKAGSALTDTWFDVNLPLNHDLVAIIGNKGSGKSALADVAALAGSTKNYEKFSFLTEDRFRDPIFQKHRN